MTKAQVYRNKVKREARRKLVRRGKRQNKLGLKRLKRLIADPLSALPSVEQFKPIYSEPPRQSWIKGIINKFRGFGR